MASTLNLEHKIYVTRLLIGLIICLLMTISINLIVDPYGLWNFLIIPGITEAKSERRDRNYLFKAADLINKKPKTLLIGSSRVALGLSPSSPVLRDKGLQPVYNAGLTGGHLHAIHRYLEHALYNNPQLETVIWGLDFFSFSENVKLPPTYSEERLVHSRLPLRDISNTLLSLNTLINSINTILSNIKRPGFMPYTSDGQLTATHLQDLVSRVGMINRFETSLDLYLNSKERFADYKNSETVWKEFAGIIELLRNQDVKFYIYVSPVHISMLEAIKKRGLFSEYKTWIERITSHTDIWDYSRPNIINTEKIANKMSYYWDVSHYKSEIGDLVYNNFFSLPVRSEVLGQYLTSNNVRQYLQVLEKEFLRWEQSHPEVIKFVSDLKDQSTP